MRNIGPFWGRQVLVTEGVTEVRPVYLFGPMTFEEKNLEWQ